MRSFLFLYLPFFCFTHIIGQEVDTTFHPRQKIGFGISNIGEVIKVSTNNTNPFPKTVRYLAEYHHEIDTGIYIRFGVSSAISSIKNGNLRNYFFKPLNFNLGVEKLITVKKLDFVFGADLFYTMTLNGGSQFGSGMWWGNDFGVGIAPIAGIDYTLNKDWIIGIELEIGVGLYRDFVTVGYITKQIIKPGFIYPRTFSLSFKYSLWNS